MYHARTHITDLRCPARQGGRNAHRRPDVTSSGLLNQEIRMRKLGTVVVGLLCAGALLATQASVAAKSKEFKDQVTLSSSLKVGSEVLKPGDYQVTSDGSKITFKELVRSVDDSAQRVNTKVKAVSVPCQTKPLPSKSKIG